MLKKGSSKEELKKTLLDVFGDELRDKEELLERYLDFDNLPKESGFDLKKVIYDFELDYFFHFRPVGRCFEEFEMHSFVKNYGCLALEYYLSAERFESFDQSRGLQLLNFCLNIWALNLLRH